MAQRSSGGHRAPVGRGARRRTDVTRHARRYQDREHQAREALERRDHPGPGIHLRGREGARRSARGCVPGARQVASPVSLPDRVGRRDAGARKLHGTADPGARSGVSLSPTGSSMHWAGRLDTLGTEQAYVVLAAAKQLEAAGHRVVHLEIREPDMPTPPHVVEIAERITPRRRGLILNLPHNPTGGVATPEELAALAALAQRHDLWVISDEVYGQIRYDGRRDSIAALPGMTDRTVIVDGFSKGYSMTGWRLGYAVVPRPLADPMTTLLINNVSCTATFVQHAGIAALTGPQDAVARMVTGLKTKRDRLVAGLNAIAGITTASPAGAFYCFPDISGVLERTGLAGRSFAERLLAEQHVAVLAGTAFGPGGEGHLRMCYATDPAELDRALAAIRRFVEKLEPVAAD